jgi:polyhydroxyalkanoate synthesis repressor PhaR
LTEAAAPAPPNAPQDEPIKIKKYANRRLYNTATSSYVTLDHLSHMVKEGKEFLVHDAKTNEDITRSVLTQIIFEEESKGHSLLPIGFLRQIISFYGDSLQTVLPSYLEVTMSAFNKNQEQMRQYVSTTLGDIFPFKNVEDMGRQNLALLQRTMSMFNPFGVPGAMPGGEGATPSAPAAKTEDDIASLKSKLEALEKQLEGLSRKG